MVDGLSGAQRAMILLQSKEEPVRHGILYGFHALTQLCGKGSV